MSYLDIIVVFLDSLIASRLGGDLGHLFSWLEKEDKEITFTKRTASQLMGISVYVR
jgi:hypothetical protein